MKQKKLTQQQRILQLEKAVTSLYAMIQAIIDKLPNEKNSMDNNSDNNINHNYETKNR